MLFRSAFQPLASFAVRRHGGGNEVRLVWDAMVDGLTPGDYRADFYVDDGTFGFGRRGVYAGAQTLHYGAQKK